MSATARNLFRGFDWITQTESVATALGTLDSIQELCGPLPAEGLGLTARLATIYGHCEDFRADLDMLSADLDVFSSGRMSARWAVQESRFVLGAFESAVRARLLTSDGSGVCLDIEVSMGLTRTVLRLKDLIRVIEGHG